MKTQTTYIDAGIQDTSRPAERPPKTNWKMEVVKKGLFTLQHIAPEKTSEIIWHYFSKPGKVKFTSAQQELVENTTARKVNYGKHKVVTYQWGDTGPKVLLCHGWRSKAADFRRMIESLVQVQAGYVVEGIDMTAHGQSEGTHTALPEFRDILKDHYLANGPYEALIGHSLGGLAAGILSSEISPALQPKQLFVLSSPPFVRYFFHDTIRELGYKDSVYEEMCKLVEKNYAQPVEYFDLRDKAEKLQNINVHLIYDHQDHIVPYQRGEELREAFPNAHFVQTKGLGHYKIIASPEVISYIRRQLDAQREQKKASL